MSAEQEHSRYTNEQAAAVFNQDPTEVLAHFAQLAEQQRAAVERAIETLTGMDARD